MTQSFKEEALMKYFGVCTKTWNMQITNPRVNWVLQKTSIFAHPRVKRDGSYILRALTKDSI